MNRVWLIILLSMLTLCQPSCGSKDPETIDVEFSFVGANVFQDPDLNDILFFIADVDDPAVRIAFPPECSPVPPPIDCGFDKDTPNFRLDPTIDKERRITITVQGRDSSGNRIFEGVSAPFINNPSASPITISVAPTS